MQFLHRGFLIEDAVYKENINRIVNSAKILSHARIKYSRKIPARISTPGVRF